MHVQNQTLYWLLKIFTCVDPEDLRGQPVRHHAAEAEHVGALSGHEHITQQTRRSGRTQHVPRVRHSHKGAALPGRT